MAAAESDSTVLPAGVTAQMVERGRDLFDKGSCIRCHGAEGRGHTNGPSLRRGKWLQHSGTYNEIVTTIINGVPLRSVKGQGRRFPMNPRGGPMRVTDEQARDLAAYVWSISRGKTR